MKKFYFLLLSFLALSLCANAAEKTGTITFGTPNVNINATSVTAADDLGNSWTITTVMSQESFTQQPTYSQIGASKKPATSITFNATLPATVTVNSVEAKFGGFSKTAGNISLQVGDTEVGTGSLSATSDVTVKSTTSASGNAITISITNIAKGVKAYYIKYTYDDGEGGSTVTVAKPEIKETSSANYGTAYLTTSTATATITAADVDAIKYAITDGAEPAEWIEYNAEVSIESKVPATKTLWAKAIKGDKESAVVKQEFKFEESIENTKETAYTTKQAIDLINATSAEQLAAVQVYVKGEISKIDSYNSTYKSITYWLDNNTFEVYSGKGLDNADFAAKTDIEILASVIVCGNIKKYNSTYEFDKNNYLVEYTKPAETRSIAINGNATKTEYEAGETFSTQGLEVVATLSDGSTLDVTSAAAWTIEPETLTVETTTVKVTAEYDGFSASKDVAVTVVAAAPSVTLDLTTTAQIKGEPTADLLEYDANVLIVSSARTDENTTAANNYYGGKGNYTSTRFYTGNSLTFTPAANFEIVSITYNATTEKYATALANSTWSNASATADGFTTTITPVDGTKPFSATIGGTTGATSMVIKYKVTTVKTVTGLDAVLLGEVGKKYQINATLRVNYKDANYVYASTTKGGFTKTAPTEAQKEEWWSDKAADFNQNDWVAIQGLVDVQVGAEIEAGSVATLVSNDAFPVVEFVTESHTTGTAIEANTYRVANFVDSDNELVKKLWLVDPQPAEHCFVKGYVASLGDVVEIDGVFVAEIKSGEKDVVTMYVNYNPADFSITATGWYRFEGVVVNGTSGLELNAVKINEGTATGVEGVETSSVKVYGAEGVINVESEEVAPIAVYSANGAIVSSVEASSASIAVAPGFYIVKAGNSVSKVTVK